MARPGCFGVAVLVGLAVTLSNQVNAVAYLTDSTPTAVFAPRSYVQDCGKDGCTTTTAGILEGSGLPAVWPASVPLDRASRARARLANWLHPDADDERPASGTRCSR